MNAEFRVFRRAAGRRIYRNAATHGQVFNLAWGMNPSLAKPVGWSLTLSPETHDVIVTAPISATENADRKIAWLLEAKKPGPLGRR